MVGRQSDNWKQVWSKRIFLFDLGNIKVLIPACREIEEKGIEEFIVEREMWSTVLFPEGRITLEMGKHKSVSLLEK